MRFAYRDHQGKGAAYVRALLDAGHERVALGDDAEVFLTDLDIAHPAYTHLLDRYSEAAIVVYPHGGNPIVAYDGLDEPDPRTAVYFVPAAGHAEVMRSYGFRGRLVVSGFPFCDLAPLRLCPEPRRVVFAPLHPLGDGTITDHVKQLNTVAFEQVLASGLDVTVRLYGTPEMNGLWAAPGVRWVASDMVINHAEADDADVVVAGYGTYGFLAVARGCPTVMYGLDNGSEPPAHWNTYSHLMEYPVSLDRLGFDAAVALACRGGHRANYWRERMIGGRFRPSLVARVVERVAAS